MLARCNNYINDLSVSKYLEFAAKLLYLRKSIYIKYIVYYYSIILKIHLSLLNITENKNKSVDHIN